jgi:glycosyltransferase involved in cell wall biosynthesis
LKVAHIVGDSGFGGGSYIVIEIASGLKQAGHDVEVIATDPVFVNRLRDHGIDAIKLPCIWRDISPLRDISGFVRLVRFLKRGGYDCVHTHTSKAGFVGRLAARYAGIPIILHTVHGFAFHESSPALMIRFYSALERLAAACSTRVVTVSWFHRDWALRLRIASADKLVAIPNGIRLPEASLRIEEQDALRRSLGLRHHDFVVMTPGRLAAGKGLEHLLAAAADLRRNGHENIRMVWPGDGPLRAELVARTESEGLSGYIVLPGFREDIIELLQVADVIALPSEREGLSIALLEALGAGKPVIASRIGSNEEATDGGRCARMVPYGSPAEICRAIEELSEDADLRQKLGQLGRERVAGHFTIDVMRKAYCDLYQDLESRR